MSYIKAEVVKVDEKTFRVMLSRHEIGTSKNDTDARFHVNAINDALDATYRAGQESNLSNITGIETVEVLSEEQVNAIREQWVDPKRQCKNCGKGTTYTRIATHGLCMKCELEEKQ